MEALRTRFSRRGSGTVAGGFGAGLWRGLAAVAAMAAVAGAGVQLLLAGADAGARDRVRLTAAVVTMAVGAPVQITATGLSLPAATGDRQPSNLGRFAGGALRDGLGVAGEVRVRPLGVTAAGVSVLAGLLLLRPSRARRVGAATVAAGLALLRPSRARRVGAPTVAAGQSARGTAATARRDGGADAGAASAGRRPDPVVGAGAVAGFVAGVAVCVAAGPVGPVRLGPATFSAAPDRTRALLGALLVGVVVAGAWLAARGGWRRPIAATAAVLGGLAALGTAGGVVPAAVAGGAPAAGAGLLAGANLPLTALPWALGVPWSGAVDGRLGDLLAERIGDGDEPARWLSGVLPGDGGPWPGAVLPDGGRPWWLVAGAVLVVLLCAAAADRGPRAAARLAVVTGAAFALVTAATGMSASAVASVLFLRVPVVDAGAHGAVAAAAAVGVVAGGLAGLVPIPRLGRHGNPARGR